MISVVILAFNSAHFVTDAVDSVLANGVEVIILDNGSSDATWAVLSRAYNNMPTVRLLRHETGLGFAGGNNYAASLASGDTLLFLNDDCVAEPGCLAAIAEEFGQAPDLGVLQCAVAVADGSRWDTLGHFMDLCGFLYPVAPDAPRDSLPSHRYPLFAASGAALAIRRSLFLELEGFDDDMEFLFEETDLCWRALLIGAEVAGSVQAVVRHRQLARYNSGTKASAFYLETRNRIRGLLKNLEAWHAAGAVITQLAFRLAFAARRAVAAEPGALADVLRAIGWNVRNARGTRRGRRQIQRRRSVSDRQLVESGHLLRPTFRTIGSREGRMIPAPDGYDGHHHAREAMP